MAPNQTIDTCASAVVLWNLEIVERVIHATGDVRSARLLLRPIPVQDAEVIFDAYARDEEVARYLIWRPHKNLLDTTAISRAALQFRTRSSVPMCWLARRQ